eukprot:scaffold1782_cov123-Isochrysis_galbana.AAC.11
MATSRFPAVPSRASPSPPREKRRLSRRVPDRSNASRWAHGYESVPAPDVHHSRHAAARQQPRGVAVRLARLEDLLDAAVARVKLRQHGGKSQPRRRRTPSDPVAKVAAVPEERRAFSSRQLVERESGVELSRLLVATVAAAAGGAERPADRATGAARQPVDEPVEGPRPRRLAPRHGRAVPRAATRLPVAPHARLSREAGGVPHAGQVRRIVLALVEAASAQLALVPPPPRRPEQQQERGGR